MVKMKKLVAFAIALAMLVVNCNITAFAAAEKPTATIGDTVCNGAVLTGDYDYTGTQPEGISEYRWYASESFSDKGVYVN